MPYFVDVILPLSLDRTFTYSITPSERGFIRPGMRIAVPFGRNKIYTALALMVHENEPHLYDAREIHQILDEKPIVTAIQIAHWQWIASYYMCGIGDVYRGALPTAFLLESETTIVGSDFKVSENEPLSDDEFLIYQALQQQSSLRVAEVMSVLNKKNVFPVIQKLMAKKVLSIQEEITETYKPKLVSYIRLDPKFDDAVALEALLNSLKENGKQKQALLAYFKLAAVEKKPLTAKHIAEAAGVSVGVVSALLQKEVFMRYALQEDRVVFSGAQHLQGFELSPAQHNAFESIETELRSKEVCLLHGVTSSGKTEIYMRLIEQYIKEGAQVLYLLPEIALTTQLVGRLQQHFGNKVSVFHSKYSNNERVEVWNHVLADAPQSQIVIGARSALFLPFQNLQLIIVDEEHEQNFKQQDPAPRYHARDAAIVLAASHGAKVLLGSATPSIETYYNAVSGKYGLVEITERFGNVALPQIELVDLKDKYFRRQMAGHFSDTLVAAITETFERGEQVILFQNRRGFSPVVECLTCGHVPQCIHCDVSLTYHKGRNLLRCHYCGYSMANPLNCHVCSSVHLSTKGFGTEQVEQELGELFPGARTARMDQDTTRGKFAFEKLIDTFKNREIDILVGTQMLAKGLDFDNVTLVGIMNADNMLYHPDFRAFERSFQMMTQVAGRAGRAEKQGRVIIQTYNPVHSIIRQVTQHDYHGMFAEQLQERRNYSYPPFYRLVRITLKHRDFDRLRAGAEWLGEVLRQNLDVPVLGPEEPPVSRIRNEYIRTMLVKIPHERPLHPIKKTIRKILDSFDRVAQFRAVKVTLNVDFY